MKILVIVAINFASSRMSAEKWVQLPDLPNKIGVAGVFAVVSHGALSVAGGANFRVDGSKWRDLTWCSLTASVALATKAFEITEFANRC
jgi:N-acetylneuraminic acid mutarotase